MSYAGSSVEFIFVLAQSTPSEETQALRALTTACVLDTLPEERFDRITRLACHALAVPMAVVSLVDRERHWVKSRQGFDVSAAELWISLCDSSVMDRSGPVVVTDARVHANFAAHPLVVGAPHIRFFAGQCIRAPDGSPIGSLCLIDRVPRSLSREEASVLTDFAAMVDREISLLESATTDELTRLCNRRGFTQVANHVLTLCRGNQRPATVVCIDLDHFKSINDDHGHAVGDDVLRGFAKLLVTHFRNSDSVTRLGGDEFAVICSGTSANDLMASLNRLERDYARSTLARSHPDLAWSVGVAEFDPHTADTVEDLLRRADLAMYARKATKQDDRTASPPVASAVDGPIAMSVTGSVAAAPSSRVQRVLAHARSLILRSPVA